MSWYGKALAGLAFAVSADAPLNLRSHKLFWFQSTFDYVRFQLSIFHIGSVIPERLLSSKTAFLDGLEFGTYTHY